MDYVGCCGWVGPLTLVRSAAIGEAVTAAAVSTSVVSWGLAVQIVRHDVCHMVRFFCRVPAGIGVLFICLGIGLVTRYLGSLVRTACQDPVQ